MKFLFLPLLVLLMSCAQSALRRTDKLSILQGVTSAKEVEFNVMAGVGRDLKFELRSAEDEVISPEEIITRGKPHSQWVLHKMVFLRDQKKDYNLFVYENNKVIDQRLIGKGQLQQSTLKLAVTSCADDSKPEHFNIWNVLASKNPDYLLMIGDNVYADTEGGDPETLWTRYTDTRLTLPIYFQEKLIATHGLWDDQDYGMNDGGEDFVNKQAAKDIFETFFAQSLSDENWHRSYGVGGLLSLGDFNLYFLDGRFFRANHPDGRHLGVDQNEWLVTKLKEEIQPSFIIKGDQFFGGYHTYESYEGKHPKDFVNFTTELKGLTTPFIFLSGDRHLSEIMQFPRGLFGMPSFEITSSPVHGKLYPPDEHKNPWRVVAENAHVNFTLIDSLAQDNHWFLKVENFGEHDEVYFSRELAVFIKDLQNNLNEGRKRRSSRRGTRRARRSRR